MKKAGLGILIFLIVALLAAYLVMRQLQSPTSIRDQAKQTAVQAAQSMMDSVSGTVQEAMNDPTVQEYVARAEEKLQAQLEGTG